MDFTSFGTKIELTLNSPFPCTIWSSLKEQLSKNPQWSLNWLPFPQEELINTTAPNLTRSSYSSSTSRNSKRWTLDFPFQAGWGQSLLSLERLTAVASAFPSARIPSAAAGKAEGWEWGGQGYEDRSPGRQLCGSWRGYPEIPGSSGKTWPLESWI